MGGTQSSPVDRTDRRLQELGIRLPAPPTPFGTYVETLQSGRLLFLSGMLPVNSREEMYVEQQHRNGREYTAPVLKST